MPDAATILDALDELVTTLREPGGAGTGAWGEVQRALDGLEREAIALKVPAGLVREKTGSLRWHLGALMGVGAADGHSHSSHYGWALADLDALRGPHCFGPALPEQD